VKEPQKTKQEFDKKAALKTNPFSLAQYMYVCLTDYTFSSLSKRRRFETCKFQLRDELCNIALTHE